MIADEDLVRDKATKAINRYLDVLQGKDGATLYELAKALDGLVAIYHQIPDVEPDTSEGPEAPRIEDRSLIDAEAAAFPDLQLFALVDPEMGPDQEVIMSMAMGNLAEIAADLTEVLWFFENASHNDAVWEFRFGYQTHWGRHLHEVRTYLHALAAWRTTEMGSFSEGRLSSVAKPKADKPAHAILPN